MKKRTWYVRYNEDGITEVEQRVVDPSKKYITLAAIVIAVILITLILT